MLFPNEIKQIDNPQVHHTIDKYDMGKIHLTKKPNIYQDPHPKGDKEVVTTA
jgi:hypothetical protein